MHDTVGGNRSKSIQKILFKNSTTWYVIIFLKEILSYQCFHHRTFDIWYQKRDIYIYIFSTSALNRQIRTFDRVSSQVFEEIWKIYFKILIINQKKKKKLLEIRMLNHFRLLFRGLYESWRSTGKNTRVRGSFCD